MKITFPYMGSTVIYHKLFELLGHEVIAPSRPNQRTINLGVKYSPEFACFPYKVILGSYIEALEAGADTIVTSGGNGPCRAGFYNEVHRRTLQSLGYDVNLIVFDNWNVTPGLFWKNFCTLKGKNSWVKIARAVFTVYRLAHAIDQLQKVVEIKRAYEVVRGSFTKAFDLINQRFYQEVETVQDVARLYQEGLAMLESIPIREFPESAKVRIGIVGEIYVVMESSINMNIAEILGNLGCEITRSICISDWVDYCLPKFLFGKSDAMIIETGKKYMEIAIGGHEIENVGHIIDYKNRGFDGIIHLMPFACLPELVTQSIIPKISQDNKIPILTLALDEQTGIANNLTRVEAFVELLRSNKIRRTA
jgi:predicted nucleotide-binding protein (sugar kinase/HSP70/actin superfamily)